MSIPIFYEAMFPYKFIKTFSQLKLTYSEKATKFCEISTIDLTGTTQDKSTVEISQNFVALSEYTHSLRKIY